MHTCLLCAAQPVDRLAYARDMALFAIAFRTGSRGSDLAKPLAAQVLCLPSSQGIVLNFQFTKTVRDGTPHASLLPPDKDMPETCVVAAMIRADGICPRVTFSLKYQSREIVSLNGWPDPFPQKPWQRVSSNTWNKQAWRRGTLPSIRLGWVTPSRGNYDGGELEVGEDFPPVCGRGDKYAAPHRDDSRCGGDPVRSGQHPGGFLGPGGVGTFPPARRAPPWSLLTAGGTRHFSVAYTRKYSTRVSSTALF